MGPHDEAGVNPAENQHCRLNALNCVIMTILPQLHCCAKVAAIIHIIDDARKETVSHVEKSDNAQSRPR